MGGVGLAVTGASGKCLGNAGNLSVSTELFKDTNSLWEQQTLFAVMF